MQKKYNNVWSLFFPWGISRSLQQHQNNIHKTHTVMFYEAFWKLSHDTHWWPPGEGLLAAASSQVSAIMAWYKIGFRLPRGATGYTSSAWKLPIALTPHQCIICTCVLKSFNRWAMKLCPPFRMLLHAVMANEHWPKWVLGCCVEGDTIYCKSRWERSQWLLEPVRECGLY